MRIGGLQKLSLIDYPGKLSCVVFTQGCNYRCRYCHNPELVLPESFGPTICVQEVIDFLWNRKKYLDGVVITGGEPTIHKNLISFIVQLKKMGYLVKLDTNGSQPQMLESLIYLQLIDYIAMDVKAPIKRYVETVGVSIDVEAIRKSIDLIICSGIKHEFRTTVVKPLCSCKDLDELLAMVKGAQKYHVQKGRIEEKILDQNLLKEEHYSDGEFNRIKKNFVIA